MVACEIVKCKIVTRSDFSMYYFTYVFLLFIFWPCGVCDLSSPIKV